MPRERRHGGEVVRAHEGPRDAQGVLDDLDEGLGLAHQVVGLPRRQDPVAALDGRDYVVPEHVKAQAIPTLAHRLALDTKARYAGVQKEDVVRQILDQVPVGV